MKLEVKITDDQSHTLYVPELDEHYHSTHGAIQESKHVFIEAGLQLKLGASEINILEIGFGTGLNALLTLEYAKGKSVIHYSGIEKYPLKAEVYSLLGYAKSTHGNVDQKFIQMHEAQWDEFVQIDKGFRLRKVKVDLIDFVSDEKFDLIYFDAFSPETQPEMWSREIFQKMYKLMNPDAVLTTYCAKGVVRRELQSAGFKVERLPGPPGKREMLRAIKEK